MRVVLITTVRLSVAVVFLCLVTPISSHSVESLWKPFGSGVNGTIYSVIFHGNDMIVAGDFDLAGGVTARNVARWDGSAWHAMAAGLVPGTWELVEFQGAVIAYNKTGYHPADTEIVFARWDGSQWSDMGMPRIQADNLNGSILASCVWQDKLILGGDFDMINGVAAHGVIAWDGTTFTRLGDALEHQWNTTTCLASDGLSIFAGSRYFYINGVYDYNGLAKFDGTDWVAASQGFSGEITDFGFFDNKIFAYNPATCDPPCSTAFFEWSGSGWLPADNPKLSDPDFRSLHFTPLAGALFAKSGSTDIAYWNGTKWQPDVSPAGNGPGWINVVTGDATRIVAAGHFSTVSGAAANSIAWKSAPESDGDGLSDYIDNCPTTANANQSDIDLDGIGDVCDPCFACEQTVHISRVEGSYGTDTILARTPIRIVFSLSTLSDSALYWMLMGYKMYSPDGALWGATTYDSISLGWKSNFKNFFFSNEPLGTGSVDTFGIAAVNTSSAFPGFPPLFQAAYSVLSTSFSGSEAGKTICIDTSRFVANRPIQPPTLYPIYFADKQMIPVNPRWIGPRCFTIWDCGNKTSGNVDCDPSDRVDISDLTNLIDHLYLSGAPLCCPIEANVDGDPGVDLGDISRLIDHLYISFIPLESLP